MGIGGISIWQIVIAAIVVLILIRSTKKIPKWLVFALFVATSRVVIQLTEYNNLSFPGILIPVFSAVSIYLVIRYYLWKMINVYTFIPFIFLAHFTRVIIEDIGFMIEAQELWFGYLIEALLSWETYPRLYSSPYFFETFILILLIFYIHKTSTATGDSKMKLEDVRGMVFIPRSDENIYSTLEKAKFDAVQLLGDVVHEISEKYNINIEFTHSLPYSGTIWLQVRTLVLTRCSTFQAISPSNWRSDRPSNRFTKMHKVCAKTFRAIRLVKCQRSRARIFSK